jgi:hypothetical protein
MVSNPFSSNNVSYRSPKSEKYYSSRCVVYHIGNFQFALEDIIQTILSIIIEHNLLSSYKNTPFGNAGQLLESAFLHKIAVSIESRVAIIFFITVSHKSCCSVGLAQVKGRTFS